MQFHAVICIIFRYHFLCVCVWGGGGGGGVKGDLYERLFLLCFFVCVCVCVCFLFSFFPACVSVRVCKLDRYKIIK